MRDLQLLLVLDDFEQVLGARALITTLLRAAPAVRVLATSRVPLRVYGEHEIRASPLRLPPADASAAEIFAAEAVQLFMHGLARHVRIFLWMLPRGRQRLLEMLGSRHWMAMDRRREAC
ncbi:MAG: hypothetical protein JO057_27900 [Chloroflexi bacterium]|nr:hypothetical protein [Chloroflexota bacterium]